MANRADPWTAVTPGARPAATTPAMAAYMRAVKRHRLFTADEEREHAEQILALRVAYWRQILAHAPFADTIAAWVSGKIGEDEPKRPGAAAACARVVASAEAVRFCDRKATRAQLDAAARALAEHMAATDPDSTIADLIAADLRRIVAGEAPEHLKAPRRITTRFASYVADVTLAVAALREARGRFARANLRLVIRMAHRMQGMGVPLQDMIQEGNIGLMKAVDRFEPARGFRFSTYATWWIQHAIRRAIANRGRLVRLPQHLYTLHARVVKARRELLAHLGRRPTLTEIAAALETTVAKIEAVDEIMAVRAPLSLDAKVYDDGPGSEVERFVVEDPDPADHIDAGRVNARMEAALASLDARAQGILRQRFGLDGESRTLAEIGEDLGLSRERVRQLQVEALAELRAAMEAT